MIPSVEHLAERFTQLVGLRPVATRPLLPVSTGSAPSVSMAAAPATATPRVPTSLVSTPPAGPVQTVAYSVKGYHLEVSLSPRQVVLAAEILAQEGFSLDAITGVDWIAQNEMEVVYDYFHPAAPLRVVVRARCFRDNPELPTISGVFPGANWHERETHDFFGIRFAGHPNLTPFLLPEDADYHPLRKDFSV